MIPYEPCSILNAAKSSGILGYKHTVDKLGSIYSCDGQENVALKDELLKLVEPVEKNGFVILVIENDR